MRLAVQTDVENALRRRLTAEEAEWIGPLLDEASDQVAGYLFPWEIPIPVPETIVRVTAAMAAAVLSRPSSILPDTKSLSADVYGISFASGTTGTGPYWTTAFRDRLRPFKLLSGNGMTVVSLSSERGRDVSDDLYR